MKQLVVAPILLGALAARWFWRRRQRRTHQLTLTIPIPGTLASLNDALLGRVKGFTGKVKEKVPV